MHVRRRLAARVFPAVLVAALCLPGAAAAASQPGAAAASAAGPATPGASTAGVAPSPAGARPCNAVTAGWACRLLHGRGGSAPGQASPGAGAFGARTIGPPFFGYIPSDLWAAYGLGDPRGSGGNLVALVEIYDAPALINDVSTYRTTFGLGGCAAVAGRSCRFANGQTIRVVDELGGTQYPVEDRGFAQETTLDSEMVSASCPNCSVVVVEAASNSESDVLRAMDTAIAQGPQEVSLSLGANTESPIDPQLDQQHFEHPGIAITVAAGDCSFGTGFPASSPGVVSVGGTTLTFTPGTTPRGWTEAVWGSGAPSSMSCGPSVPTGTAAGCTLYEPKPAWQSDPACPHRTMNDVAMVADPQTPVAIYDSRPDQTTPVGWSGDGGTSVGAPLVAGITGDIGGIQFSRGAAYLYRTNALKPLNDVTAGTDDYAGAPQVCLPSSYLCNGAPGYDGPTGVGTPNGYFLSPPPPPQGYWLVASDGGLFPFGNALVHSYGSTGGLRLNQPIVGMAATASGNGYWLVAADGGIFPFGDARQHAYGSTGAIRLNRPIVGMARSQSGNGYWLVASDGGIFPFGDAAGYGSTGNIRLNRPIVGMARTASGNGYWLVASDGGIFPFGDAVQHAYGSTGAVRLNQPVVGMAATATGNGYWLVASDGGIFPFGDAGGDGSTGGTRLNQPIVGMAASPSGRGYWLVASDGGIFPFGDAEGLGSAGGIRLNKPVVGMAASL
ncbi:MAG TPA: S8 family serine peptidase, partial [Candidatus Dormibacteraeota bacterium]|nr:S8 family serine peptidase [Candidatus Dormibacteraeota bacterium]